MIVRNSIRDAIRSAIWLVEEVFNPQTLFLSGERGVWYDPSDLSTLFQDSAGTIPVTGTEQPVGLMLDKSKGLVRGPELVNNGDFSSGLTGWAQILGTVSVIGNKLRVARTSGNIGRAASKAMTCAIGKSYEVSYTKNKMTSGSSGIIVTINATSTAGAIFIANGAVEGAGKAVFTATQTTHWLFCEAGSGADGDYAEFDNISVRELPGNHATQATAASRPIFRDVGGVRYLQCDGVDDGMVTGSIDFTGTDKMLAVIGVRKLSDAVGVIVELSANQALNAGAMNLITGPAAGTYQATSRGTSGASAQTPSLFPTHASNVVSAVLSIGEDITRIRAGGNSWTNNGDQGTGNYGNYPLYLFRRGGSSLPFNGLFYGAMIAGSTYSASQIASAERYLAGKSGVTL